MSMSKNENGNEVHEDKVVRVGAITGLPYTYIPYDSYERARINHPDDTLYIYEAQAPKGFRIIAFPVVMFKPKDDEETQDA